MDDFDQLLYEGGAPTPEELAAEIGRRRAQPDFQTWLDDNFQLALEADWLQELVLSLCDAGANVNKPYPDGYSPLWLNLVADASFVPALHQAGARFNDADHRRALIRHWSREEAELFAQYADPHPQLARIVKWIPQFSPKAIARLLRLGVPCTAFGPADWERFLSSEPGQWWQLRAEWVDSPIRAAFRAVLPPDLIKYLHQRL